MGNIDDNGIALKLKLSVAFMQARAMRRSKTFSRADNKDCIANNVSFSTLTLRLCTENQIISKTRYEDA